MKGVIFDLLLVGSLLYFGCAIGCAARPPALTPQATQAFTNTQVEKTLDLIRDTAQNGAAQVPPLFTRAGARTVTLWHQATITVMYATSSGWQAGVLAGLDQVVKDVSPAERQILAPYVTLAKTLIAQVP